MLKDNFTIRSEGHDEHRLVVSQKVTKKSNKFE